MSSIKGDLFTGNVEGVDEPDDLILVRPVSNLVTDMDDYSLNSPKLDEILQKQQSDISQSDHKISKPISCLASENQNYSAECCSVTNHIQSVIYWRKPLISAVILVILLATEFSFLCLSAISFFAYVGLSLFVTVNLTRMYFHFVAKTNDNFIKKYLDCDITISQDKVTRFSHHLTEALNKLLIRAREVFLLTDPAASAKFAVLLYLLTYIGARFNFLTLCILCTVGIFFVPKFYEKYQSEIDKILAVAKQKYNLVMVNAGKQMEKLPIVGGRKTKTQ